MNSLLPLEFWRTTETFPGSLCACLQTSRVSERGYEATRRTWRVRTDTRFHQLFVKCTIAYVSYLRIPVIIAYDVKSQVATITPLHLLQKSWVLTNHHPPSVFRSFVALACVSSATARTMTVPLAAGPGTSARPLSTATPRCGPRVSHAPRLKVH